MNFTHFRNRITVYSVVKKKACFHMPCLNIDLMGNLLGVHVIDLELNGVVILYTKMLHVRKVIKHLHM